MENCSGKTVIIDETVDMDIVDALEFHAGRGFGDTPAFLPSLLIDRACDEIRYLRGRAPGT